MRNNSRHQDPSSPTHSLVFLANRIGRLLANRIRQRSEMERHGLMPHHMGILVELWGQDGMRQQDLAVSTIKDKATIARSLDSLEKNGIVLRIPDADDKRNNRIFLTPKGRKLKGEIWPHAQAVLQDATDGIGEEALATCYRVLNQVYQKLIKDGRR